MTDHPSAIVPVNHTEPVARRIRAMLGGEFVLDTTTAIYLWEWPHYPRYQIPLADVRDGLLVAEGSRESTPQGTAERYALQVGALHRPQAARVFLDSRLEGISGTVSFGWSALDAWFEEDEQVFVHPRSPYVRVDALRSSRTVRVERDGVLLAQSSAPVFVFETGLPTRVYFDRACVRFEHLEPTETITACPYKGTTSGYWSARVGEMVHRDLAWAYDFPTRELLPIAGLVAFYNERVDLYVDDRPRRRP